MELKLQHFIYIGILLLVYFYTLPRYLWYLPTIPIYDNEEASLVKEITKTRTYDDKSFFELTDPSITNAFLPYVDESKDELTNIITDFQIQSSLLFFKYSINRPRPYQIDSKINILESKTGNTPSMPAGHAGQAYYLANILGDKYPNNKKLFDNLARRCDEVRVKAGIHYPSDGEFSKYIVDVLL